MFHISKQVTLIATLALVAAVVSTANASVITVTDSIAAASPRTANGADVTITESGWGLDGGNAVVAMFAAENSDGITATFASEPMDVIQIFDGNRFVASIAYLINPVASTGDVVINANNSGSQRLSNAYAIFSLANVGSIAGSQTRIDNGDLDYTTSLDGGYVFVAVVNNNFSGPAPTVSGGNANTDIFSQAVDGNQSTTFAIGDVPIAGSYTENVNGGVEAATLVAFIPIIPEPASLTLLGLGGLLIASRPRKRA